MVATKKLADVLVERWNERKAIMKDKLDKLVKAWCNKMGITEEILAQHEIDELVEGIMDTIK